jgi:hypothetical protein
MKSTVDRKSCVNDLGCSPAGQAYSEDGVDLTLIRWMLSLTPDERWDMLDQFASDMLELRNGEASV